MIFDADGFDAGRFREVEIFFWSGARMPKSMIQQLQAMGRGQVRTNYGATELCSSLTCSDPDLDIDTLAITIGRSRSGELRVVKQDGNACEAGEIGEIQARREFCMAGYLNNPEATAAAYTEDGWLKTGDLVQVLPDGNLSFVGRDSDMYKSGGENVYPAEIEECIEANPKVNLVAVIGVADELYGEVGRAYIKKDPGADLSAPEIKAWCAERLANFKIPKKFDFRDELPLLANGKIDKVTLRKGID
jgi:acyl-CoA synthetase (AMP-forming)/AMP-acid ligase II